MTSKAEQRRKKTEWQRADRESKRRGQLAKPDKHGYIKILGVRVKVR